MRLAILFLLLAGCASPGSGVVPGAVYRVPQDAEACAADPDLPWCRTECEIRDHGWCQ